MEGKGIPGRDETACAKAPRRHEDGAPRSHTLVKNGKRAEYVKESGAMEEVINTKLQP